MHKRAARNVHISGSPCFTLCGAGVPSLLARRPDTVARQAWIAARAISLPSTMHKQLVEITEVETSQNSINGRPNRRSGRMQDTDSSDANV